MSTFNISVQGEREKARKQPQLDTEGESDGQQISRAAQGARPTRCNGEAFTLLAIHQEREGDAR
jgi:hypothetical protein